jgi:amino acid transporter
MLSLWLLAKVFSSGCTAMTGVEAVSNGTAAFREPTQRNAKRTLTIIIVLLMIFLSGIALLCRAYNIGATDPASAGYQSILSQLISAVMGRGWFYYVGSASILAVLALSANTSYADFPRLTRAIAMNDYLPHVFKIRGRRLLYSHGIVALVGFTAALLIAFGGVTDRLIPLFAIGAFMAFTLSQAGMVMHWKKQGGRHREVMQACLRNQLRRRWRRVEHGHFVTTVGEFSRDGHETGGQAEVVREHHRKKEFRHRFSGSLILSPLHFGVKPKRCNNFIWAHFQKE